MSPLFKTMLAIVAAAAFTGCATDRPKTVKTFVWPDNEVVRTVQVEWDGVRFICFIYDNGWATREGMDCERLD